MKKNILLNVIKLVIVIILSVVLIMNVFIILQAKLKPNEVPSIFGYKPFIVLSGSMESEIYAGDLVFVKKIDANSLKIGDIIAFRDEEDLVTTHRILSVVSNYDDICFETKGDNNNVKDADIVCSMQIEGVYVSKISRIGHVILFFQEPLGFIVMILLIFIIFLLAYMFENKRRYKLVDKDELKEFEEFKRLRNKK